MLADSAALMYEISKGLPGMGVAIVSTQDRMLEGFINENGREPIKEEQAWLWGLATVSVAGETLGFKGLVGKFKGLNTWLTRATAKSPAFGRFLAKILAGGTVGLVAEGSSGVISGTAEHMGIHIADGVKFPTLTEQ